MIVLHGKLDRILFLSPEVWTQYVSGLLKFVLILSMRSTICKVVKWPLLKANCFNLIFSWGITCNSGNIIRSKTLDSVESRDRTIGFFGYLPDFGIIIEAFFQAVRKQPCPRQLLYIFVSTSTVRSGSSFSVILVMLSSPGAFMFRSLVN